MSSYNANIRATEGTPLLAAPVSIGVPGDFGTSTEPTTTRGYDATDIFHEHESFPILGKVVSNVSCGIIETTPTSIHPDNPGDLRLKNDGSRPRESDRSVDHAGEIGFHGGISKKRFWIIFTGLCI